MRTHSCRIVFLTVCLVVAGRVRGSEFDAQRAARAGRLEKIKEHTVLRLRGADIYERGFAEGYLLAAEIRDDFDAALQSLPTFGARKYEDKLLPWAKRIFEWDVDATAELDGIFKGMLAKLGADGMRSQTLGRAMTRDDVMAMNTIADYFGPACSGFAAWGSRTQGGEVVYGRTLDFPLGSKVIGDQILIASEPVPARPDGRPERKGWVAVGWPGMIAHYSAMSADGLAICLHDGYNRIPGGKEVGAMARGLLLRRMLESIDPMDGDPAQRGALMAAAQPIACGNLFQMVWPKAAAEKTGAQPSAVLEFDSSDRNVDIRRADGSNVLVLTNHYRVRAKPVACARFDKITDGLALLERAQRPIGLVEERKLLMAAEQPIAAHSLYFFPDRRALGVALTQSNIMSPRVVPTMFTLEELLNGQ